MSVFDITFNDTSDSAGKDPDPHSERLKADHQRLWTRELPDGQVFSPAVPVLAKARCFNYLMFAQTSDEKFTVGSDAIISSYTTWLKPKALVEARNQLTE